MLNFVRTDDSNSAAVVSTPQTGEKLDRAGATASFVCAIHCAIMPFVITVLPLLGLGFLSSEPVEWALLSCSAVLGTLSLCVGFRQHKQRRVFGVLGLAMAFLVAGRILHEHHLGWWGPIFMVIGGFTMMAAHVFNRTLCRSCRACSSHGCCN